MLGTILSIMGGLNTAHDFYKNASGIIKPNENNQILQLTKSIERLSDLILYAPNMETVRDVTQTRQRKIDDLRDVRESLEPVQKAIGQEILSSAMILTPEKMQKALAKSPWEVLLDIRPLNLAAKPDNADMVPVLFNHNGVQYLGWQMRGTLPILFNCEYDELWQSDLQTLEVSSNSTVEKQELEAEKAAKRKAEQKRQAKLEAERLAEEERNKAKFFHFEVVSVNAQGEIVNRTKKQAKYETADLNGVTLEMVSIPGGTFIMGLPETEKERLDCEGPQHEVTISPFYLGKYSVTHAQWQAVMGNNPSRFKGDNRPVENVSWDYAVEFCKKVSKLTGENYRLPTEAEWEYACRAGTTTPFSFGETITTDLANYYSDSNRGGTTDVGSFPPNAFGIYDMHGNVWELCADGMRDYNKTAQTDPIGPQKDGGLPVVRGGSWLIYALRVRAASRNGYIPGYDDGYLGFRCARVQA